MKRAIFQILGMPIKTIFGQAKSIEINSKGI
jgi:hypothetical protein